MNNKKYYEMNAIKLAYIGDAVFSLFVREYFATQTELKNSELNKKVNSIVCAKNQAILLGEITNILSEEEHDILQRARNAHVNNKAKNSTFSEYNYATQFEAILGYLYLTKNDKLDKILNMSIKENL